MFTFLLVDKGRLSFTKSSFEEFEIHAFFFTADRSAWPVLKRDQAATFLKNFRYILFSKVKRITFLKGNLYTFFEIGLSALI